MDCLSTIPGQWQNDLEEIGENLLDMLLMLGAQLEWPHYLIRENISEFCQNSSDCVLINNSFFVVRAYKIYSSSNIQEYNTLINDNHHAVHFIPRTC